jgi:hypothetical protein
MGRSSVFLEIFGGTVVPSMDVRKRKMRADCRSRFAPDARRGGDGVTQNVPSLRCLHDIRRID